MEGVGHHSWFMGRVGKWMKTMKRDVSWRGIHYRRHLLELTLFWTYLNATKTFGIGITFLENGAMMAD